jgi:hypothetical protein
MKVRISRIEVPTAMKMFIIVFCVVSPCGLVGGYHNFGRTLVTTSKTTQCHNPEHHKEDGGNMFLRNVVLQDYMVSQLRKLHSTRLEQFAQYVTAVAQTSWSSHESL